MGWFKMFVMGGAVAASTSASIADSVDMKFVGKGAGYGQDVWIGNYKLNNVFVGELMHQFSNGTGDAARFDGLTLTTFCTDVYQRVNSSGSTYEVVDTSALPQNYRFAASMGAERAQAVRNVLAYRDSVLAGPLDPDANARAFAVAVQLTIWEIVFETDVALDDSLSNIDLASGTFYALSTRGNRLGSRIRGYAAQLVDHGIGYAGGGAAIGFASGDDQDQVTTFVPLPSTAGLGLIGLSALAARRRR